MNRCLCCEKNQPASLQKVCPLCGHVFKGQGWWGIDAHWKSRHEAEIPYATFWEGLCDLHRDTGSTSMLGGSPKQAPGTPIGEDRIRALALRSSHIENILIHALIASIAQELWKRDPWLDFQVFKAEVDDAGFDLVLGCKGTMRYIQVKQTHLQGNATKYSLRVDFSKMTNGCAVVIVYDARNLAIDHCLFYGRTSGETMPPIEHLTTSQSPGRRTADGARKIRENYRDVPRRDFLGPLDIPQLVDRLFP